MSLFTAEGMARRLGTEVRPAMALYHRHIKWNQRYRTDVFERTSDPHVAYEWAAAQVVELFGWLGWLRGGEIFSLEWDDITVIPPSEGPRHNLPVGAGAILLRLNPSTKSDRTKTADVVIAYRTASGIEAGRWLTTLRALARQLGWGSGSLFRHRNGSLWTSYSFRHNHLFPLLTLQQLEGDAFLRVFDGTPGNTFADKFHSMHLYRRGGKTHTSRKREGCVRKATLDESVEHARWETRNTGKENMATHYTEWSLEDRLYITLLCS